MNHLDSMVTKLDVVGVKLYINEAEKVNFYVYFKKYLVKSPCYFGQKCNQQLTAAGQPDIGPFLVVVDKAAPLRKTVIPYNRVNNATLY